MLRPVITTLALSLCGATVSAQDLSAGATNLDTFSDVTARHVGDILTVIINEAHQIRNEDRVDRQAANNLATRLEAYTLGSDLFKTNVLPRFDARTERAQTGQARQEKDSQFDARIAVSVVDVQPNGNLVIAGKRVIKVDDETKTLRISGLVRSYDIGSNNSVSSMAVADARITFTSEGGNDRMVTRGPVAALFDTLVWAVWPF